MVGARPRMWPISFVPALLHWGTLIVMSSLLTACSAPRVPSAFSAAPAHPASEESFTQLPLSMPVVGFWRAPSKALERSLPNSSAITVHIYLEGDGAAWSKRARAPRDPTPTQALAATLASLDPAPWVVYLGRPCQYLKEEELARCSPQWWQDARYGDATIAMMNRAIDEVQAYIGSHRKSAQAKTNSSISIRLIGYSGGGVMATLLVQERNDIDCLITIASPLDLEAWVQIQGLSPLAQSRNPARLATPKAIPQTHWYGQNDRVVPPQALGRYPWSSLGGQARVQILPGYTHDAPWAANWLGLMAQSCPRSKL